MTWQPTKTQLEDAALAGGLAVHGVYQIINDDGVCNDIGLDIGEVDCTLWQPHLPTTQGKADLMDLMLAAGIEYEFTGRGSWKPVDVTSNLAPICIAKAANGVFAWAAYSAKQEDKHAALAQAVIGVAAQVGAKMREGA